MAAVMKEPPSRPEPALVWRHTKANTSLPIDKYAPFGNADSRNGLQARVEIPLMIRALGLPLGCRILEVGSGPGGIFVHETRVAQRLAHPVRSFGRSLPWSEMPSMLADRSAVLWSVKRKSM